MGTPGYNLPNNVSPSVIKSNGSTYGHYEDGDEVQGNPENEPDQDEVNTKQNVINIQKGELLIHPETGKILQEFSGINPLTGGNFEPHAKGKKPESPNNFTLADPGLFVITKKTAKQYKDSMDNNDKISQKTVLMNIRNAKIAKEGGLKGNYAYGDTITDPNDPFSVNGVKTLNVSQFSNPDNYHTYPTPAPANYTRDPQIQQQSMSTSNFNTSNTIPTNNQQIRPISSTPTNTSSGFNVGSALDNLNKYGPSLVNLAQGTFGQVNNQAYAKPTINPYTNQILSNLPKDVDLSPIINDIHSNQNLANKDLSNTTNNASVYRANRQQIGANADKATTNARLLGQSENNKVASERAGIYGNLGEQSLQDQQTRRQYDLGIDDINARKQAAKQNLFNAGLSQLQQTTMNDKANAQKAGMDKYSVDLMKQIFGNAKFYDLFDQNKIQKYRTGQ